MKILCPKSELLKSINSVSKAVSAKTTMPILGCILIHTRENRILMTANDSELGIETEVTGSIDELGSIAIEAKLFSEIIRRLPDAIVQISADESNMVQILCEKSKFSVPGRNPEEFSHMPEVEKSLFLKISALTLKSIIAQTIFSAAESSGNIIMSGELFEQEYGRLRIASLDGHRISIRNVELKEQYEPVSAIIPAKTLNELSKILPDSSDCEVTVYFTVNLILFEFESTKVVSRLIEGKYFNLDSMLMHQFEMKITVNKKDFAASLDRAMLLVRESDRKPLVLDITDDTMEISMRSAYGEMLEDIPVEKTGKDMKIGFNPKFLSDAIRVIDDENIDIYMIRPNAPCFIKDAQESYIYMILPVNFNV